MVREFSGKNVQDAIKAGLEELDIAIDEADIEIIQEGGGGIFGIGAKKAIVRITPIDDDFSPAKVKSTPADDEALVEAIKDKAEEIEDKLEAVVDKVEHKLEAFADKVEDAIEKTDKRIEEGIAKSMDSTEHVKFLTEFLNGLFERMSVECAYEIMQKGDTLTINISSAESGKIIGHRGETLDAIQYIARLAIHKQDLPYRSIVVQTENYREKREQTLRSLAKRLEEKVHRTGKRVTLEPMKPYERRIIHETLQNSEYVTTDSQGDEPKRYVVIFPKK